MEDVKNLWKSASITVRILMIIGFPLVLCWFVFNLLQSNSDNKVKKLLDNAKETDRNLVDNINEVEKKVAKSEGKVEKIDEDLESIKKDENWHLK